MTPQGDSQQPQEGAAERWAGNESATGSRDPLVSHVRPAGAGGGTLRAEAEGGSEEKDSTRFLVIALVVVFVVVFVIPALLWGLAIVLGQ